MIDIASTLNNLEYVDIKGLDNTNGMWDKLLKFHVQAMYHLCFAGSFAIQLMIFFFIIQLMINFLLIK